MSSKLINSSFDPSGQLYFSVAPSLDLHQIKAYQVSSHTQTASHVFDKGTTVQDVGIASFWSQGGSKQKKKRKRNSVANGSADSKLHDVVAVVGTTKGSVLVFSPSKASIVSTLDDGRRFPIASVSYDDGSNSLWTCDSDGFITQWDDDSKKVAGFKSPEPDTRIIAPVSTDSFADHLLVASTSVHLVNPSTQTIIKSFPGGFANPVTHLTSVRSNRDLFLASSKAERNIIVGSISKGKVVAILTCLSEVQNFSLNADGSVLAATTEDGSIELFNDPLTGEKAAATSRKAKAANLATKSNVQFKIVRPSVATKKKTVIKGATVRIENVFVGDKTFTVTWLENGVEPVFEAFPLDQQQSGSMIIERQHRANPNGFKDSNHDPSAVSKYNESNANITSGREVGDLDDDNNESGNEEEEATLSERLDALGVGNGSAKRNDGGAINGKTPTTEATKGLEFSTPGTFATILNQALRTNDHALLESCLVHRDEDLIKLSIQNLESSLAVRLLERVAEKIARSPHQAGPLNVWIKWVMIAHGGYLVTIPNLVKTLSSLHSTLADRVVSLPRLLALQGRLEMLHLQMEFRRDINTSRRRADDDDQDEDDEDDDEVEYVEEGAYIANGEEDDDEETGSESNDEDLNGEDFLDLEASDDEDDEESEGGLSDMEVGEPMSDDESLVNGK